MTGRPAALLVSSIALVATAAPASGANTLRAVAAAHLPALERAQQPSSVGDADAMQARYDMARAIVEELHGRASPECGPALRALGAYARANIAAAEAFDREASRTAVEARVRATAAAARRGLAGCAVGQLSLDRRTTPRVPAPPLPPSSALPVRAEKHDRPLEARLEALARGFNGYSAVVVHDLATGRSGSWNADAPFPAASTVKLGVLVAALRAAGARPERSDVWYDLVQITRWSSNLAANRLYARLGSTAVETALRRMGATASTYTGEYRVGTARDATPRQPPLVSQRVTTAHDLATVLETIHKAAFGDAAALRAAKLSRHQAQLALGLLLGSKATGANASLFKGAWPPGTPVAQKNGWLSDAFHTAAIAYTPRGPVVYVLLTYRDGLTRAKAARLGARVVAAALR